MGGEKRQGSYGGERMVREGRGVRSEARGRGEKRQGGHGRTRRGATQRKIAEQHLGGYAVIPCGEPVVRGSGGGCTKVLREVGVAMRIGEGLVMVVVAVVVRPHGAGGGGG